VGAAKWLALLFTALLFAYIYVEVVLNWWGHWRKKFLFG